MTTTDAQKLNEAHPTEIDIGLMKDDDPSQFESITTSQGITYIKNGIRHVTAEPGSQHLIMRRSDLISQPKLETP